MKLIVAFIQPEKLSEVKKSLADRNVSKMSVTNALGCGQQQGYEEHYRGAVTEVNLLKKVRIEVGVNDEFVKPAVDAITTAARTGSIGDGKIFVINLEQCIRIRTGEIGIDAIG